MKKWRGEICKRCGRDSYVGFEVPDNLWEEVIKGRWNVVDVNCFLEEAHLLGIGKQDTPIYFYPVFPLPK